MIKPCSMAPEPLSLYINHLRFIGNNDGKIKLKKHKQIKQNLASYRKNCRNFAPQKGKNEIVLQY